MLKRFFLVCSGADLKLLETCSNGEQNKFVGIGATVFFTALMAAIAANYALFTVFNNIYTSIFFGIIWGLLIFNLDRFIVATMRKKENIRLEIFQALPRLILAFIIAVVISKPLELKIFEKEINQVLLTEKNQMTLDNKDQIGKQFLPDIEKQQTEIQQLKNEILAKEKEVDTLYETYIAEAEGRKGTKQLGKGPVYKEKREKHDAALGELTRIKEQNNLKIDEKEQKIKEIQALQEKAEEQSQPIISNFDGLMARVNALKKLPWLPSFFVFLLFLAIETAPIFSKLISSKSEYDFKFEHQESEIIAWIKQQTNHQQLLVQTDNELNSKVYEDIKNEEDIYQHKKEAAKNLLKLQTTNFFEKQQRMI